MKSESQKGELESASLHYTSLSTMPSMQCVLYVIYFRLTLLHVYNIILDNEYTQFVIAPATRLVVYLRFVLTTYTEYNISYTAVYCVESVDSENSVVLYSFDT